jgi:hypothetical protein
LDGSISAPAYILHIQITYAGTLTLLAKRILQHPQHCFKTLFSEASLNKIITECNCNSHFLMEQNFPRVIFIMHPKKLGFFSNFDAFRAEL